MSPKPRWQIPSDYAPKLGVDPSFIYHINAGRRTLRGHRGLSIGCKILDLAEDDPRLQGLTIFDLWPELKLAVPHICKLCPLQGKVAESP